MTKPKKGGLKQVAKATVKPIAPTKASKTKGEGRFQHYHGHDQLKNSGAVDDDEEELRDFAWAAKMVQAGFKVKRDAWIGNKFLTASGGQRNVIMNEDMLATDWIIA